LTRSLRLLGARGDDVLELEAQYGHDGADRVDRPAATVAVEEAADRRPGDARLVRHVAHVPYVSSRAPGDQRPAAGRDVEPVRLAVKRDRYPSHRTEAVSESLTESQRVTNSFNSSNRVSGYLIL